MKKTSFLCFYFVVVFKVELIWFSFIVIVALGSRARLERAPAAVSSCAREPARQLLGLSCGASAPLLTAHRCCSSVWIQPALSVLLLLPPGWNCPCSPLRPPASPTFFGELLGFSFGPRLTASPSPASRWTCTGFCTSRISGLKFPEPVLWGPAWVGVSRFCCHSSALSSLRESRTDRTSKVREPNQPAADAVTGWEVVVILEYCTEVLLYYTW